MHIARGLTDRSLLCQCSLSGVVLAFVVGGKRWGRDISHPSRRVLGPAQPPIQWVPGPFPSGKAAWVWL